MFGSIFKSNPKYNKVKTNEKNSIISKTNIKSKIHYVNMLYIYFFNGDDYNKLKETYIYLPIILDAITVCNNCDNNVHKEIKKISYVRYSQKNGLQKTVKFNENFRKNNRIKEIKSLYTEKFDLSTKYANYETL